MTTLENLTVEQLRKAVAIKEQIESLQGAGADRRRRPLGQSEGRQSRAKETPEGERRRQGQNGCRREGAVGKAQGWIVTWTTLIKSIHRKTICIIWIDEDQSFRIRADLYQRAGPRG